MDNRSPETIDRNRRLLGLALDCRLIYPRKKEKIEGILKERLEADDAVDVMDILKEENVLTDEKADYLLDLDAHTATCTRDRMFGRLAVANGMASDREIDSALAFQQTRFKQTGESMRLGRILVDRGILTHADCTAILITQNRIRHEDLLDAMETLGRSPGERDTINKHFGAIAIKKGLVTADQVGEALRYQRQEAARAEPTRFLGTILGEMAGLSPEDTEAVLDEQRLMEIRRLDLLKALYPVKAELKVFKRLNRIFSYTISTDGIEAFACKRKEPDAPVPVYEFIIWLRKAGICFGVLNDAALADFIEQAPVGQSVMVARGQEADPARDQGIKFYFEDRGTAGESDQDNGESLPAPGPVTGGDLLAQIIPGQEGRPGKNVLGHPVYPAKPAVRSLYPGQGVVRRGNDFIAADDGFPRLKNGTSLVVVPQETPSARTALTMTLAEDTRDQYLQADLMITGDILTGAVLKCRSLTLKGNLLGEVGCGGDISVNGSIGQSPPQDAPVADVLSHGSVGVTRALGNARIRCAGTLTAMNATAEGVWVCAGRGLALKGAISGPEGPCVLRAGLPPQDPLLSIDRTLETRTAELAALRKEDEIALLTEEFRRDMERARQHLLEQDIYRDLIEIIEGPELYQYPELRDKLDYLYGLPDHSSVREYFLKIPETDAASEIVAQFIPPANRQSLDEILKQLRGRLDPEPESAEETPPMPETERLEISFKARLDALEGEADDNLEKIGEAEREIASLASAREKLGRTYLKGMSPSDFPVIRVKNKCEKGSIIRGILASLTLEETVYNVRFREVADPRTLKTTIVIEN